MPATPAPRMTTLAQRTPGHTADQDPPPAARAHQVVGAHQRRHPAGHLAHRGEQGKRVVGQAHRLVGDGGVARGHQRLGARARGGQVQVGEQDLVPGAARAAGTPRGSAPSPRGPCPTRPRRRPGSSTILAPVAMNSASGIDEPTPAPCSTQDGVPGRGELRTPAGVMATRYSSVLHLLGDPDDHPAAVPGCEVFVPEVDLRASAGQPADGRPGYGMGRSSSSRIPNRPTSAPRSSGTSVLVDLLRVSPRKNGGRMAA